MNLLPPGYDAWRLRGPDEHDEPGTEPGDVCGRCAEPDGGEPRGYRPKPCTGTMKNSFELESPWVECDTCGEVAE
jgi:hypothetical protein